MNYEKFVKEVKRGVEDIVEKLVGDIFDEFDKK